MKFKTSIALNLLLLATVGALTYRQASKEVGNYYYRKMVGVVCGGAAEKLQKGDIDSVKAAMVVLSSDRSDAGIRTAGRKLGVMQ
jgi:hypothetical protein